MKNLIIAAIVMLVGTTVQLNASNGDDKPTTNGSAVKKKSGNIGVAVEIDFGRRKKGCQEMGICKIKLSVETDESPLGKYSSEGNGTITLTIPLEYVSRTQPDKVKYFTGQGQLIIEEDYTLPRDVSTKLGAERPLTIKIGNYPLVLRDGVLTIIIGDML